MNQIRIKWVFITLFFIINAFLGYLLYQSNAHATGISEETVRHTVSVLKKKNISIDETLISRRNYKMREVSVKNITEDTSSFVIALTESGWEKTQDGFQRNGETISFSDGKFEYRGFIPLEEGTTGTELSETVRKKLKSLSFGVDGIKLKVIEQMENGMRLEYVQTYEDYEIFGTRMTVTIENSVIVSVSGIWLESMNIESKKQDTLFVTEALICFAEEHATDESVQITEIRTGYYISEFDENVSHKVMQMLPGVQITTASGAKFCYDIRSPQT